MMKTRITQMIAQSAKPQEKLYTLVDETLPGLSLRVYPSGNKMYYVDFTRDGQHGSYRLGKAEVLTIDQARDAASGFLANVSLGEGVKSAAGHPTLQDLIDIYTPWTREHRKSAEATLKTLSCIFSCFLSHVVSTLTVEEIEEWRSRKLCGGVRPATINRQVSELITLLNWSVKRGILESSPLSKLERLSEVSAEGEVRYLSEEEYARLMAVITGRTDRMKPLIILSLNTGIRRGIIFGLRWSDIDFARKKLHLRAEEGGTEKSYSLPLNAKAMAALLEWREQRTENDLVFPSPKSGGVLNNVKKTWVKILKEAEIKNFRWEDMRHDFAVRLIMHGANMDTVRKRLGHAGGRATELRYTYLMPEAKAHAEETP